MRVLKVTWSRALDQVCELTLMLHARATQREGIITYKCTSHLSNIKTWSSIGWLPVYLK